jgi:hypothetical protein
MSRFFVQVFRPLFRAPCGIVPLALILLLAAGCFPFPSKEAVPFDMRRIIPKEWVPMGELIEINVDQDENTEWLLFYRYDLSQERKESKNYAGPIGGVIFDRQIDKTTGVSVLARHDLLPEIRTGKGQGFLGENKCEVKPYDASGDGKSDNGDLAVLGYGYGPSSPSYLSIFHRKDDVDQGYKFQLAGYFHGDGGIRMEPAIGQPNALRKVIVNTRLNERSLISKRAVFIRQDDIDGNVQYKLNNSENSLVFTYGIPENPYYPEAAVLAYYHLMNAGKGSEADRFLLPSQEREHFQQRVQEADFPTTPPTSPAWEGGRVLPLTLTYTGASKILTDESEDPIYYTVVTVQESTGSIKVWEVIGLLDGRCDAEICWQFLSWHS